ncbi:MAG: tetratricopeptide repeat protein [Chitinophagaceae bacterium]|nr:MAG: tetratricopeptide repeat protein [Chitinophagaceae bacterium]
MKKPIILAAIGLALTASIFLFGRTSIPKKPLPASETPAATQQFNIDHFIDSATTQLTPAQVLYVTEIENGITRGDIPTQQKQAFSDLANFWKDSARVFEPYAYYISEAAKLDNSEKNLTFAAQLFLENLRAEHDEAKLNWKSTTAIELFERAIKLNPNSDDLRIGLGSCYVFGKGRGGDAQQTMKGIQELLVVARKDSSNMKAQFVLGVGGFVSGQYDKAIERFLKVVKTQPDNLEAVAFLADTYAAQGNKAEAVKWYNVSKRMVNNPAYSKQVDERIAAMK